LSWEPVLMLEVSGLSCIRGDRCLFAGLGFSLEAGGWLQVEGENGAGKTSLLRIIAGLLVPAEGDIHWKGVPVRDSRDEFNASLLYLGHAPAIKEELTPLENLRINAAIGGQTLAEEDIVKALRRMGLRGREDLPSRFLSQGQKRRVALARLLVSPATLWVLDEPFVALDVAAVTMLCEVIGEHLQGGGMALFTSHQAVELSGAGKALRLAA
jgi:heme exporter protein A